MRALKLCPLNGCLFEKTTTVYGAKILIGIKKMALEQISSKLMGVGLLLKQQRLSVPLYQRPYTWERPHVKQLFDDITNAKEKNSQQYFVGTVVLTKKDNEIKNIIDGQQRIVTFTILISAIRNYFQEKGDTDRADIITKEYLTKSDVRSVKTNPRVLLLPEDGLFYKEYVIDFHKPGARAPNGLSQTQKRLYTAIKEAHKTVSEIVQKCENPDDELFDLLDFIENKAVLVYLDVGNESNAFVIFEVLNDRGLDLTVADLLKNYIFSLADQDALPQCQTMWTQMSTVISNAFEQNDIKNFVRHAWIAKHGLTREKDLYESIKKEINTSEKSVKYTNELYKASKIYSAFINPSNEVWSKYSESVRDALYLFDIANITQVRPLLISVFENFSPSEVNKTIPMLVSWSVRFLICGVGGSGTLEDNYSARAKDVSDKKIKTARQLYAAFKILPTDDEFQMAFSKANVSKPSLARWYLTKLEAEKLGNNLKPITKDINEANLEHILPQNPDSSWHISEDDMKKYVNRIGNQTLLETKINAEIGNKSFTQKKGYFVQSRIEITRDICNFSKWGIEEINIRQMELSKLAIKLWKRTP